MNSTATALTFQSKTFDVVQRRGQVWLRAAEIAEALGYAREDSVSRIYDRNRDEFSDSMSQTVKLTVSGLRREIRVFSLRGAHLIAMFARTPVAKAFRHWVLDILDREVGMPVARTVPAPHLDDDTRRAIQSLCTHAEYLNSWWNRVAPGLRLLSSRLAGVVHDDFVHAVIASRQVVRGLGLESNTRCAVGYPWEAGYTERSMYVERMRGVRA